MLFVLPISARYLKYGNKIRWRWNNYILLNSFYQGPLLPHILWVPRWMHTGGGERRKRLGQYGNLDSIYNLDTSADNSILWISTGFFASRIHPPQLLLIFFRKIMQSKEVVLGWNHEYRSNQEAKLKSIPLLVFPFICTKKIN